MGKKLLQLFDRNILLKGSAVMLFGSIAGNFGNYLYHLLMGRMLGPADYGVLESLISLNYFLTIPISVLVLVIVKFVSTHKNDEQMVSLFIRKVLSKVTFWGFGGLVVFLLFFPVCRRFLKINSFFLFLGVGLATYFGIFSSVFNSFLQGLTRFVSLSILNAIASWSKTAIAVGLVAAGLKVYGSVYAFVLSSIIVAFVGFQFLKKYLNYPQGKKEVNFGQTFSGIKSYGTAVFFFNFSMTSIYTLDIILSKYFLPSKEAGYYAALSVLGKIIFFASTPITAVMFPLISEKFASKAKFQNVFYQSVVLVLIISLCTSVVYFFHSELMISLLYGKEYLSSAKYLGYFAVFISLYSLSYLFVNFFLSIAQTKVVIVSTAAAILQAVLILFFHKDIFQIVWVNIFSASLLLAVLLILFLSRRKIWTFSP